MADVPCNSGIKVTAVYSGVTLGSVVGGSVNMSATFVKTRPGTRVSPAAGLDEMDVEAEVVHQELVTFAALGTAAQNLVFTTVQLDGGANTITLATMRPAGGTIDFNSKPHRQTSKFTLDCTNTENIATVTVA